MQDAIEAEGASASPLDAALEVESEQLVWAALHKIPETYREPLVLYYRENRSTKQVAEAGPQAAALPLRDDRVRGGQILDLRVRRGAQVFDTRLEAIRPPDGIQAACARP